MKVKQAWLEQALEITAGSKSDLAKRCKVSQTSISQWINGTRRPSPGRAIAISKELGIDKEMIRPDLWG